MIRAMTKRRSPRTEHPSTQVVSRSLLGELRSIAYKCSLHIDYANNNPSADDARPYYRRAGQLLHELEVKLNNI